MFQHADTPNPAAASVGGPILVIDTATRPGFVGVWESSVWLAREDFSDARRQGEEIFPAFARVFAAAGLTLDGITGIAVTTGPGSFSALRVGLCAGKSVAETRGLPIVGVPLLHVVAMAAEDLSRVVVAPASRNQMFVACYDDANRLVQEPLVAHLAGMPLPQGFHPERWMALGAKAADALTSAGLTPPDSLVTVPAAVIPALIAAEAQQRFSLGQIDDPMLLDAMYVRQQDADGSWTDARAGAG